jgi:hypothetical protein
MLSDGRGSLPFGRENVEDDLYTVCRDKIRHENELTNHRLTWNFTIQGLLFASYGLCVQSIAEIETALASREVTEKAALELAKLNLQDAIWYLGVTGASVSGLIFVGALAAQIAIVTLGRYYRNRDHRQRWRVLPWQLTSIFPWRWWKQEVRWVAHGEQMPGILGGGNFAAYALGLTPPLLIPLVFVGIWYYLVSVIYRM